MPGTVLQTWHMQTGADKNHHIGSILPDDLVRAIR